MNVRSLVFVTSSAALLAFATAQSGAQSADWTPPVGIPAPPFGISETAPARPNPWTAPVAGYYYVDETASGATDASNTYGTPGRPRVTIPNSLPAGSVVELHGTYSRLHRSPNTFSLNGTASNPVYIRGRSQTERALATAAWHLTGTYFIVENIDFAIDRQLLIASPINRGVLRHSSVKGTIDGGGIGIGGGEGFPATELLLFRNVIHDAGDMSATNDTDRHGISIAPYTSKIWILENEIYGNSGSGIQVNANNAALQPTLSLVYIGRNNIHGNRQAGVGIKQAMDVIVSENFVHDIVNTSWSASKCFGYQYAPERVWILNNHCHNALFGVHAGSDSGLGIGEYSFIIGNTFHGIHAGSFNPDSAWSNGAIMLAGGTHRVILNNTIYDVDNGIETPGGGTMWIVNNIVARVAPLGSHVYVENGNTASASTIHHNLFEGATRIKWGSTRIYDVNSFQATFGKGQSSLNADPLFVNPAAEDFSLQPQSPAIDRGVVDPVYDGFKSLYGLDIAMDMVRTPRPTGAGWDMGAFEAGGPRPPTNLRILK